MTTNAITECFETLVRTGDTPLEIKRSVAIFGAGLDYRNVIRVFRALPQPLCRSHKRTVPVMIDMDLNVVSSNCFAPSTREGLTHS